MIESKVLEYLLKAFDLGASTAENDPLLESAKIETQEFHDLYHKDRIDIIRGIKGSGKTALYRVFYFLRDFMQKEKNLYCEFGVEVSGDPVFRLFYEEFEDYNEIEFENFWNIYFLLLINKAVSENIHLKARLGNKYKVIKQIINSTGVKIGKNGYSIKDSISGIQKLFRSVKLKGGLKTDLNNELQPVAVTPLIEIEPTTVQNIRKKPIYITEFRNNIAKILDESNIKFWILLDRLDEVFPHRSEIERNGLKGLLKSAYNFSCPQFRIKTFLRDDIFDFISNDGFTALTHISDRCSTTMTWSKDELLNLVIKRIAAIKELRHQYVIDATKLDNFNYRYDLFYKIFPSKIGKSETMEWIFKNCSDGNGVVTPRDIIDFFKYAKTEQLKALKINPKDQEQLISENYFKKALAELSKHKRTHFLFAEFPHLKDIFSKFDGGESEYSVSILEKMFGTEFTRIKEDLISIGFLQYNAKRGTYRIPIIWRKGFNIRRKIKQD